MQKSSRFVLIALLITILDLPRFIGIGKFVSLDEPYWLNSGANFYYALGQRQFEKTIMDTPAVTTYWAVTGGMLVYFREYRGLEQGYLKRDKLIAFFSAQDKSLLQLLIDSRIFQIIVITILLLLTYILLDYFFGWRYAFFTTALLSLSPYFLGHSRLLNHEAMMGLFLLVSLLSMTAYLFKERKLILLVLSAVSGALAQLSKASALVLLLSIGMIYIFYLIETRRKLIWDGLLDAIKTLGVWFIILVAAYTLFWPGMWVAPGKMLYEVYGGAYSYAFQGAQLELTQNAPSSSSGLSFSVNDIRTFISGMIWRITPLSWLGLALGIWALFTPTKDRTKRLLKWLSLCLLLTGITFIVMFGIAKGRNSPHYILTSYICVETIAGLGWISFLEALAPRQGRIQGWMIAVLSAAIIAFEAVSAAGFYPYYYTYYNPLLEAAQPGIQNPTLYYEGYGEGLEQAAAYLAQKPHASEMTVMSYYGYGCFSFYFPGKTIVINGLSLVDMDPETLQELRKTDYVVINYHEQKRNGSLAGFENVKPEKSIWLNGLEYIRIYRTADLLAVVKP